jgi:hypothetical protein
VTLQGVLGLVLVSRLVSSLVSPAPPERKLIHLIGEPLSHGWKDTTDKRPSVA